MRTPSMVIDVSAIEVASTILRRPGGAGAMARILLVGRERAVERDDVDRWVEAAIEQRLGAADFAGAGQERQQRASVGAHRPHNGVGDLRLDRPRIAAEIAGLDREGAAFGGDHGRVAEKACHAGAVDGRRHHQEPQILAQALLHVAGQRQAEIGVERALVELVEQDGGDAIEHGIVEDEPGEDAFGEDFDAGFPRELRAEAHPQAHRLADAFAERLRHPLRGGARGEPARLEHQDASLVLRPFLAGQHQRHARRLAGARRGDQHGGVLRPQRRGQIRQRGVDGQGRRIICDVFHSDNSGRIHILRVIMPAAQKSPSLPPPPSR